MNSRIQIVENFKGFQFGEVGDVKAIVLVEDVEDALASVAREAEEAGCRVLHAEERGQELRLFVMEEVGVWGLSVAVGCSDEVEIAVGGFGVGIDADEAAEMEQEDDVEVCHGRGVVDHVEPLEGGLQIAVERCVFFLFAECGAEKFGEKEGEGGFYGREGYLGIVVGDVGVDRLGQSGCVRAYVGCEGYHRQGLPERDVACASLGACGGGDEGLSPVILGEEVDDERCVAILDCAEHYSVYVFLHVLPAAKMDGVSLAYQREEVVGLVVDDEFVGEIGLVEQRKDEMIVADEGCVV